MRYAKYKPTGIAWLPEVPEGWEMVRCKCLFTERIEKSETGIEEPLSMSQKMGIVPTKIVDVVPNAASSYVGAKKVYKGDIVFNKLKAHLGVFAVSSYDGLVSPDYAVYESTGLLNSKLIEYLFHTALYIAEFKRRSRGVAAGFMRLYSRELFAIPCVLPPLPTQRAIVAYLDEKCGKVDRLVVAKEKEAALLKELKQSMIAEAVTRGVRPKRRLIPSGIPWLPEVPEGWEVKTLRQFLKMVSRKGFPEKQLLSVTREQGVVVRNVESKEENHNFIPEDLSNYKLVKVGDFAINKMKSWQGSYGVSEHEGIVSPAYYICKLSGVDRSYFSAAIRSRPYVSFFARFSKGIRVDQWDLSPIALKEIPFLLPPIVEQREIVAHIEARAAKIDAAVKGLEREVAVLKEYKQRLIADVVTGQRKVA